MLLRRAPRELYRVYGEDEFLSARDWIECEQQVAHGPAALQPAGRSPRGLAAAAILCGAVGAVAGLVLVSGSASTKGSRRGPVRRLRAEAHQLAVVRAHTRVWRSSASEAGLRDGGSGGRAETPKKRSHSGPRATRDQHGLASDGSRRRQVVVGMPARALPASREAVAVEVSSTPAPVAEDVPMAGSHGSTSPVRPRAVRTEFGFEQ